MKQHAVVSTFAAFVTSTALGLVLSSSASAQVPQQGTAVIQPQPGYVQPYQQVPAYPQYMPVPQYQVQPMPMMPVQPMVTVPQYQYQPINPYGAYPQYVPQQAIPGQPIPQQQIPAQQTPAQAAAPTPGNKPAEATEETAASDTVEDMSESATPLNTTDLTGYASDKAHDSRANAKPHVVAPRMAGSPSNYQFNSRPATSNNGANRMVLPRSPRDVLQSNPQITQQAPATQRNFQQQATPAAPQRPAQPAYPQPEIQVHQASTSSMNSAAQSIAPGSPRYETCTKVLRQESVKSSCYQITMTQECSAPKYVVMCQHSTGGDGCQTSDKPLSPDQKLTFMLCLPENFLLRHAACDAPMGCEAFANRLPAYN